jgi:branched-chain amino acid aminotransferase
MVVVLYIMNFNMDTIQGSYFISDSILRENTEYDGSYMENGRNIYEVMRVIDGILLFMEDHLERMSNSVHKSGLKPLIEFSELAKQLYELIQANHLRQGNIKVVFHYGENEHEPSFKAYPIPSFYPDKNDYLLGVNTGIFEYTRPSPEIKNWIGDFRDKVSEIKKKKSWYEVILQNKDGVISEGSQSNIFLIRKNRICTAPLKIVLGGITRKKILDICHSEGIAIEERTFNRIFLFSADAVFLTGTSPKVLPVKSVGEKNFAVDHPILRMLMDKYDAMIASYIQNNRNAI